ncbi:uncharacterized protein DUF411 [Rhizobium azibense]|nr:uncharacterized protein DUF411 [Rhizobium azibense]
MTAYLWGYNGQSPGPTIEAVEDDRVRIFVTNKLPEHTTIDWHGMLVPSGMDGVGGLTQPHIPVGKTYVYEFDLVKSGTFTYHPHSGETVQMAMGMMGLFVVHPKAVQRLLRERPPVRKLAVPCMPPGSLGMGDDPQASYDVFAIPSGTGAPYLFMEVRPRKV